MHGREAGNVAGRTGFVETEEARRERGKAAFRADRLASYMVLQVFGLKRT
jgi:hypothetical protein